MEKLISLSLQNIVIYFLINFKLKKNIRILEYDNKNKTLNLCKEEIRCIRTYPVKNFSNFIDNKNGNIISIDSKGELNIWKKNRKKKIL